MHPAASHPNILEFYGVVHYLHLSFTILSIYFNAIIIDQCYFSGFTLFDNGAVQNKCLLLEYCSAGDLHSAIHKPREEMYFHSLMITSLYLVHTCVFLRDLSITTGMGLKVMLDIASGLQFLHASSTARSHRDLKSANILLDVVGDTVTAKICDFGGSHAINGNDNMTAVCQ